MSPRCVCGRLEAPWRCVRVFLNSMEELNRIIEELMILQRKKN